jgi:chromosome segregation ATPase
LQTRLTAKTQEIEAMQDDLSSVVTLRRELIMAQQAAEEVRGQLDAKGRELMTAQSQLSTGQRAVSSLRRELSSGQSQQVSTGQGERVSTGQTLQLHLIGESLSEDPFGKGIVQLISGKVQKPGRWPPSAPRQRR